MSLTSSGDAPVDLQLYDTTAYYPLLSCWEQSREKWEFVRQCLAKQTKGTDAGFNGLRSEQTQQTVSRYDKRGG
jgi:hypothetical protein